MRFSELDGRSIGLWGLGRETRSLAEQARARLPGARIEVLVADEGSDLDGVRVVPQADAVAALRGCDVVVRSPGVSIHRPEIHVLAEHGVRVVTATGLWLAEREGRRVIGVTGTKGKSTTATMVAHLVRASGLQAHLAGNIGRPVLDLLDARDDEWAVVELSSYQIADLATGPEVAVVTNLYREHLDWHGDEATYRREKLRLLGLPGVGACVIPAAPEFAAVAGSARVVHFGVQSGWHVAEDGVRDGATLEVPSAWLPLRGRHNAENLCAACAALDAAWIPRPPYPEAVAGIAALPHRLQTVHAAGGVEWVDDSISTTPESTIAALDAYPDRQIVLIAGGLDRGQDYTSLGAVAAGRRAVTIVALPVTGARLAQAARDAGVARVVQVPDMAAAVAAARDVAEPGAVVLLSPAAPSYNSYRNFEERGDHFAALAAGG
jgi:UDP-N-acetylmuramoyl-L-alanine---L-glutamate ligase